MSLALTLVLALAYGLGLDTSGLVNIHVGERRLLGLLVGIQCFDAVGWASGRASGL